MALHCMILQALYAAQAGLVTDLGFVSVTGGLAATYHRLKPVCVTR